MTTAWITSIYHLHTGPRVFSPLVVARGSNALAFVLKSDTLFRTFPTLFSPFSRRKNTIVVEFAEQKYDFCPALTPCVGENGVYEEGRAFCRVLLYGRVFFSRLFCVSNSIRINTHHQTFKRSLLSGSRN